MVRRHRRSTTEDQLLELSINQVEIAIRNSIGTKLKLYRK